MSPVTPAGATFDCQSSPNAFTIAGVRSSAEEPYFFTYAPGCMSKTSGPLFERRAGVSAACQSGIDTSLKFTLMSGYSLLNAAM